MISIKQLLGNAPDQSSSVLMRAASLLLEGIALHVAECNPVAKSTFQNSMRQIRHEVEAMTAPPDVVVAVGGAIQLLEAYNRGIENFVRVRGKEYQELVGMISKTLIEISNAGEASVQNLHGIEKDLHTISQIDDLRELKSRLGQSLKALSEETVRQKQASRQIAGMVGDKLLGAKATMRPKPPEIDPITGLPGHEVAASEIASLIADGADRYIAVLCVERLDLITNRFGSTVGDQVLMIFSQFVAQQLSGKDKLFSWRGPGLVAILERRGGRSEVQSELRHTASSRLEHSVTMGSREVLLPISLCWTLLSFNGNSSPHEIYSQIDAFVASPSIRN